MRLLVTGGAGFIGSNIVRALLAGSHSVTVLDNLSSGYRSNLDGLDGVRLVEGDVRDEQSVARAFEGVDAVFHLAASVGNKRSLDHPVDDAEINVIGTLRVLEAARRSGVRKVIYSSSAGIFGELKILPIREDHPIEPDTPYGSSKLAGEKECLAFAKQFGLETICLRYFNVYGPNQRFDAYGNVIPIFAFQMLEGKTLTVFGDGEQTRDFVNVRDVVQANLKALAAKGISGAFNIASGTKITINELIRMLEEAASMKAKVVHAAKRPGDVLHSLADVSAAKQQLGFDPTVKLPEGLRQYMEWARQSVS